MRYLPFVLANICQSKIWILLLLSLFEESYIVFLKLT